MSIVYGMQGTPDLTTMSPGPSTLIGVARELLARLQGCAAQLGVILPERQLVYMAPVPVDCPQVVVAVSGYQPLPLWEDLMVCTAFRWCGQFHIVISRKTCAIPTREGMGAPTVASMEQALQESSDDAEVLALLVSSLREIGPELTLSTPAPEGGYQSVVLQVLVPVDGGGF